MPEFRFSPRQLEAFIAVASLGSFSQAAEQLHLSPSAVSSLIGELERVLGFSIFDRTTRRVALSAAGREFLPAAMAVQRQMRQAAAVAEDMHYRLAGVIRVAAPMVLASVLLPPLMAAYAQRTPGVAFRVLDTPVEWLADRVFNREADIAVGPDRKAPEGVNCLPLFPSPWVLWCAADHPLAAQATLTWQDLRGVELCAAGRDHEQSVDRMTRNLPEDQRITPTQVVDNISTALGLAAAGLAVTVSPAYVRALADPMGLVMRRILEPEVMRRVSIYVSADLPSSAASIGFQLFLQTELARRPDLHPTT